MNKFFLLSCLVVSMPSVFGMDKYFKKFTFTNKKVEVNSEENNVYFSDNKEINNRESNVSTKDTEKKHKFPSDKAPLYTKVTPIVKTRNV